VAGQASSQKEPDTNRPGPEKPAQAAVSVVPAADRAVNVEIEASAISSGPGFLSGCISQANDGAPMQELDLK
jgi:hypothetical protein